MIDNQIFFASLNLPKNPLNEPFERYITSSENDCIFNLVTTDLSLDVRNFLKRFEFKLSSIAIFLYKNQRDGRSRPIYTDTHVSYSNLPTVAINWHLNGPGYVEWHSFNNGQDRWKYKGSYPTTTYEYQEEPKPIAYWLGKSPALLNLTQPRRVVLLKNTDFMTVLTVRLKTTKSIDDLVVDLKDYILSVNSD